MYADRDRIFILFLNLNNNIDFCPNALLCSDIIFPIFINASLEKNKYKNISLLMPTINEQGFKNLFNGYFL